MPPIGILPGNVDSFAIFLIFKGFNSNRMRMEKKEEEAPAAPPAPSRDKIVHTEIRDLLKKYSKPELI